MRGEVRTRESNEGEESDEESVSEDGLRINSVDTSLEASTKPWTIMNEATQLKAGLVNALSLSTPETDSAHPTAESATLDKIAKHMRVIRGSKLSPSLSKVVRGLSVVLSEQKSILTQCRVQELILEFVWHPHRTLTVSRVISAVMPARSELVTGTLS